MGEPASKLTERLHREADAADRDGYDKTAALLREAADRIEELEQALDGLWTLVDGHLAELRMDTEPDEHEGAGPRGRTERGRVPARRAPRGREEARDLARSDHHSDTR